MEIFSEPILRQEARESLTSFQLKLMGVYSQGDKPQPLGKHFVLNYGRIVPNVDGFDGDRWDL